MNDFNDFYAEGAQALFDRGVKEVPRAYIQPQHERPSAAARLVPGKQLPVIDLSRFHGDGRNQVMEELKSACESWGFFHLINHGFPDSSMKAMLEVVRQFFELPAEIKMRFFQKIGTGRKARYGLSFNTELDRVSDWKDFLAHPCHPLSDELISTWPDVPLHYREIATEYAKNVRALALRLLALLSESLGLRESFIYEAFKGHHQLLVINHYPPCPQPDLTLGVRGHTDVYGFTIVQHDDVPGLEVMKDGSWYAVSSIPNAFVINIGDQLEILSNGRYKSIKHRAVVNSERTRFSIVSFYGPSHDATIAPAAEVIRQQPDQKAEYREILFEDYLREFFSRGLDNKFNINSLKIKK
ncbi:hypothetical protein O6H91_16G029800 [Diphasiastrum complanatum]|uniref:Uncharacterized protein n=1 Tax=Diphasiastrum complanatum TaxID=34168 RepID=A0ACC2BC44_DIPCM|nr:hypothetical protein O6H91_Y403000 [Diphasiastrum complanatum]KAJ7526974.1 hypothetical protein O6H91_16G029800 [Diphasiastrum complanatum]